MTARSYMETMSTSNNFAGKHAYKGKCQNPNEYPRPRWPIHEHLPYSDSITSKRRRNNKTRYHESKLAFCALDHDYGHGKTDKKSNRGKSQADPKFRRKFRHSSDLPPIYGRDLYGGSTLALILSSTVI